MPDARLDLSALARSFSCDPAAPLVLDVPYCNANAIQTVPPPASFYVEPDLTLVEAGTHDAVRLISAPAAVGKTRLAEELHWA